MNNSCHFRWSILLIFFTILYNSEGNDIRSFLSVCIYFYKSIIMCLYIYYIYLPHNYYVCAFVSHSFDTNRKSIKEWIEIGCVLRLNIFIKGQWCQIFPPGHTSNVRMTELWSCYILILILIGILVSQMLIESIWRILCSSNNCRI